MGHQTLSDKNRNTEEKTSTTEPVIDLENQNISELEPEEVEPRAHLGRRNPLSGWRTLGLGIGVGVAMTLILSNFFAGQRTQEPSSKVKPVVAAQNVASQTVTVATVESTNVSRTLDATGTVGAVELLPVLPQANGLQIQQVLVEEGDLVTGGQVMAILDNSVLQSQTVQAESQVDSTRSDVEQKKAALERSNANLQQNRAALQQAEADRDQMQASLSQAIASKDSTLAAMKQAEASRNDAIAALSQAEASQDDVRSIFRQAEASRSEALASVAQAEAKLGEAKALLQQANREFERAQNLNKEGVISSQELETRATTVKTAQEGVRVAESNILAAKAKVEIAEANISTAKSKAKIAEANVRSANAKLDIASANVAAAESKIDGAEAEIKSTKAKIRSSEAKVSAAAANVNSAASDISAAMSNINTAKANVRSNLAQEQQAQTRLEQSIVRAPDSGIVAEKIAKIGDVTGPGQKLFSIIRNNQLELQLKVPETQLPQVKLGEKVQITSDADPRIKLQGRVREIAPLVDPQNRQATVKIDLPPSNLLRPGMFLRAAVTTKTAQGLTIPAKAVVPQTGGNSLVYILTDKDIVKAVSVEVGEVTSNVGNLAEAKVEIKGGLRAGDQVIVTGAAYLKDGDKVKVVTDY